MRVSVVIPIAVCLNLMIAGCGGDSPPPRKEVIPVSGVVLVDGQAPSSPLSVQCHPVAGMDAAMPTVSQTQTAADGSFKISTYESGDGVPEGEYILTFEWGEFNVMSAQYSGDKFNGRYSDPKKSGFKVKAEKGKPVDLGKIELTTK